MTDQTDIGPQSPIGHALVHDWLARYRPRAAEIVSLETQGFHYLFDITNERLIAAWGRSRGPRRARDAARMRGHPLSAGAAYHRGHAIAHSIGGDLDINLVPQLAKVNVGGFRKLERFAAARPGVLYFTHWFYARRGSSVPAHAEQGVLAPGEPLRISVHKN